MVKQGLVNLDDPIEMYLPTNVKVPTYNGHEITLEDLATHTSGLSGFPAGWIRNHTYSTRQVYDFLSNATLQSEPGTKANYSDFDETKGAAHGIASFYRPTRTASGEKTNAGELTAAHRTLPFGTRVRVTDVATGKSVTVRVNDRGPFIPGRVVDVSHSAAESLGITGRGIAKVKLDVVD